MALVTLASTCYIYRLFGNLQQVLHVLCSSALLGFVCLRLRTIRRIYVELHNADLIKSLKSQLCMYIYGYIKGNPTYVPTVNNTVLQYLCISYVRACVRGRSVGRRSVVHIHTFSQCTK